MKTMKNLVDSYKNGCNIDGMLLNALTSMLSKETNKRVQVASENGNICIWFDDDWYEMSKTNRLSERYITVSIKDGTYICDFRGEVIEKKSHDSKDLKKIKFPWQLGEIMKTMNVLVGSYNDARDSERMLIDALTAAINNESRKKVDVVYDNGILKVWIGDDCYEMSLTDEESERHIIVSIREGVYVCDFSGKVIEKISHDSKDLEKIQFPWMK